MQATPKLFLATALGTRYPSAVLTMATAPGRLGRDVFQLALTNLQVTSVSEVGGDSAAPANPVEDVTLSFDSFKVLYNGQRPNGAADPVCACFDLAGGRQCNGCAAGST